MNTVVWTAQWSPGLAVLLFYFILETSWFAELQAWDIQIHNGIYTGSWFDYVTSRSA